MRSLVICTPHPILCDKIENNEIGGSRSAYGGGNRRLHGFGWKNIQREQWGDPDVEVKIILR
jgi:hypothetical protein